MLETMNLKRVLVVEDEFITLDLIRLYLKQSGYEVAGDAINALEAIQVLEKEKIDLVLLDINIKGEYDGIWLGHQLNSRYKIPFLYLTAYSDGPTIRRAAESRPSGYLVKPFKQADIFSAIEVALLNYHQAAEELPNHFGNLVVKVNSNFRKLATSEIVFIQAFKNYLELNLINDERLVIRQTLQAIYEQLSEKNFIQVHRSFIINKKLVSEFDGTHVKVAGQLIPVSRSNKESLAASLGKNR
ncbi:hypothetical protein MASR2M44_01980 [Bacteroidota bacterium]